MKKIEHCQPNERVNGKKKDTPTGKRRGEAMELDNKNSQLQTEEADPPTYWKQWCGQEGAKGGTGPPR